MLRWTDFFTCMLNLISLKNDVIWISKWIRRGLLYKGELYTSFCHLSPFQKKIFSFLSLVTDQAYDGFHWAGSQWKGWRNRCKGKNGSSILVSAKGRLHLTSCFDSCSQSSPRTLLQATAYFTFSYDIAKNYGTVRLIFVSFWQMKTSQSYFLVKVLVVALKYKFIHMQVHSWFFKQSGDLSGNVNRLD